MPEDTAFGVDHALVDRVRSQLQVVDRLGVAFSGGVDSSVLLALAGAFFGPARVVAIMGVSPSLAFAERSAAHEVARFVGVPLVEVVTNEGERPAYRANGPDRCFHCKDELFTRISDEVVQAHGLSALAYGENADDARRPDRPGSRAAAKHLVLRPLADAGLDKAAVRRVARVLRLPSADKPAAPCLASRIPHYEEVSPRSWPRWKQPRRACALWASPTAGCATTATSPASSCPGPTSSEPCHRPCAGGSRPPCGRLGSVSSRSISPGSSPVPSPCRSYRLTVNEAWAPPASLTDFANLDHDRAARRGYPEAIYCEGKSPDQVAVIAAAVRERGTTTLFTRATTAHSKAILMVIPDAHHDEQAHLLAWPAQPPQPSGGLVLVVTAGTSDLPVAREALSTARYLGRRAELVVDVGVAGLQRVLGKLDLLRRARCLVVVAGMDGALPGVIAGLVTGDVHSPVSNQGARSSVQRSQQPWAAENVRYGYTNGYTAAKRPPRIFSETTSDLLFPVGMTGFEPAAP